MIQKTELEAPPHSVETETALLANLLTYPGAVLQVMDLLTPKSFYDERHRLIYAAIVKQFDANGPIDTLAVNTRLQREGRYRKVFDTDALLYLAELQTGVGPKSRTESLAHTLREYQQARENILIAQEMTKDAQDPTIPPADLRERYSNRLMDQAAFIDRAIGMDAAMTEVLEAYDAAVTNPRDITGLDSGFTGINRTLDGLCKGEMTVIGARPSNGKSTLVLQIAYHVAQVENVGVGFFSMEMSPRQIGQRLLAIQAGVSTFGLRRGQLSHTEQKRLTDYASAFAQLPLMIKHGAGLTLSQARMHMRRMQQTRPIGLWIFDYLQLMQGEGHSENEQINSLTMGLKRLSHEFDAPILVLSQLNRQPEGRSDHKPRLSDLRSSGGIEQDADNVLLLSRPGFYPDWINNQPEDRRALAQYTIDLVAAKTRYGETGDIDIYWNPDTGRFMDEEPDVPQLYDATNVYYNGNA